MKVGDLVLSRGLHVVEVGIILDTYCGDDSIVEYFEVQWQCEKGWWSTDEIILFSKS